MTPQPITLVQQSFAQVAPIAPQAAEMMVEAQQAATPAAAAS